MTIEINRLPFIDYCLDQLFNSHNKQIELYLAIILYNLFKEIEVSKKYSLPDKCETYENLITYIEQLDFSMDYSKEKEITPDKENSIHTGVLIYSLVLNIISYILLNANEKAFDYSVTVRLLENVIRVIGEVVICYNNIPKKIAENENMKNVFMILMGRCSNEVFMSLTNVLHCFLSSKNKQIDIIIFVINAIMKIISNCNSFLNNSKHNENSIQSYIILLDAILSGILNIKISEFDLNLIKTFYQEVITFLQGKDTYKLSQECHIHLTNLQDKIKIYEQNINNNINASNII